MEIKINKNELASALTALGKLVSRTSLIKMYQAIQIEGRASTLFFRTRNVVEQIEFKMTVDLENDFPATLVEFEQFRLAVRNCKNKTLTLENRQRRDFHRRRQVGSGQGAFPNTRDDPGSGCLRDGASGRYAVRAVATRPDHGQGILLQQSPCGDQYQR